MKCVNFIKARSLNQRLFSSLCADTGLDYQALLLHTEVRWLSRGRVLKRVCDLWEEIDIFQKQQNYVRLAEKFLQEDFNAKVAYLADIFKSLCSLNISMQGNGFTVIDHAAKVSAYHKKLMLWKSDEYDMFPELTQYIWGKEVDIGHL